LEQSNNVRNSEYFKNKMTSGSQSFGSRGTLGICFSFHDTPELEFRNKVPNKPSYTHF
jgi:hypothetical protein